MARVTYIITCSVNAAALSPTLPPWLPACMYGVCVCVCMCEVMHVISCYYNTWYFPALIYIIINVWEYINL